jgi:hypothetical protein
MGVDPFQGPHTIQDVQGKRADGITTHLVAGKCRLVEKKHTKPLHGQKARRAAARRSRSHHNGVENVMQINAGIRNEAGTVQAKDPLVTLFDDGASL